MKKVLLLFGGNSNEHKVSCKSAKSIIENIDRKLFDLTTVAIDFDSEWYIYEDKVENISNWSKMKIRRISNIIEFLKEFDIVFPIIHGYGGEDGKLQGMLDLFNIKYVGSNTLASSIGMDKEMAKIIFNYAGIPQVPYIKITEKYNINEIEKFFDYPMIVKPANSGSSVGLSKVNNRKELKKGIKTALEVDKKVLIEKYIKGKELECAILDYKKLIVSDIGEIIPNNVIYDYESKYIKESKTVIPANISKEIKRKIRQYAKSAFTVLGCSNLSRIDFFYDPINKNIYLNEINTLPGFTEISMYPKLIMNENITYKDLITFLINK